MADFYHDSSPTRLLEGIGCKSRTDDNAPTLPCSGHLLSRSRSRYDIAPACRAEFNGGVSMSGKTRCAWADGDPVMAAYHDTEWGVPVKDDRALWEMLMLEGFQAGLSWRIVLHRRAGFRIAFDGFVPERVAAFDEAKIAALMADPNIIRARAKIMATVGNARAYLAMQEAGESFSDFAWGMVGGMPILGDGINVPASTPLSMVMSAALKKRGFKFVGPVIVYAWMQAVGMVNDHAPGCFCRKKPR